MYRKKLPQSKPDRLASISEKRGSALTLAVISVVILLVMGAGLLSLGQNSRIFAARNASDMKARCAADAGLTKALYEMNEKLKVKPWNNNSLPLATNQTLPNCSAVFDYTVTGDQSSGFQIASTGKSGIARKTVNCTLLVKSLWSGITTSHGIHCENNAGFGTYPPGDDFVIRTNSTDEGAVLLENTVVIPGDVIVGPNGVVDLNDSDCVVQTTGESMVRGQVYAATEEVIFPQVNPPSDLSYGGSINADSDEDETFTISESGQYDNICIEGNAVVRIGGGSVNKITIYVTGDVKLENDAKLQVAEGFSVVMYLGGNFEAEGDDEGNNPEVNTETQDPAKFIIYGTNECELFDLENVTDFYGAVYARNAEMVLNNSGTLRGGFVGKNLKMENLATFYEYATALAIVNIDDPTASKFETERWWE